MSRITAIFKRNLHFSELIKLLRQEGFESIIKLDSSLIENALSQKGILILEIDSEKILNKLLTLLKSKNKNCKVLCIFNKDIKIPDKTDGLKTLSEPISFNELLKALSNLKKSINISKETIRFGNLIYYPKSLKFEDKKKGTIIKLTDLENKLIMFIIKQKSGATKSNILANVWNHRTDLYTHTLESLIYRLRRKIEKDPNKPNILVQINKKYYLKI